VPENYKRKMENFFLKREVEKGRIKIKIKKAKDPSMSLLSCFSYSMSYQPFKIPRILIGAGYLHFCSYAYKPQT